MKLALICRILVVVCAILLGRIMTMGPFQKMFAPNSYQIYGEISDARFNFMREMYEDQFKLGWELESQLAVYYDGKLVVNLWGHGNAGTHETYNDDTVQIVYSNSKTVTAIVLAHLVDTGVFKYEDKIAQHWPEFGQNGKAEITISDLMRHQAGLSTFSQDPVDLNSTSYAEVARLIEQAPMWLPPKERGTTRNYHASTRGVVLNELIHRTTGKRIGDYVKELLREPLGIEFRFKDYIDPNSDRVAWLTFPPTVYTLMHLVAPYFLGDIAFWSNSEWFQFIRWHLEPGFNKNDEEVKRRATSAKWDTASHDQPDHQMAEYTSPIERPSSGGCSNAKSLAKLGDEFLRGNIVTKETVKEFLSEPQEMFDYMMGFVSHFTKGGVNAWSFDPSDVFTKAKPNMKGWFGWGGWGNSFFSIHPEKKLSFSYTMTGMSPFMLDVRKYNQCKMMEELAKMEL